MNTVVVYDSQYGNTERIAQAIAHTLRTGGQATAVRVEGAQSLSLQNVDLLVVGSPTQGFRPTPAMLTWLEQVPSAVRNSLTIACFDTRFRGRLWRHSAAVVMAKKLHARRIEVLVSPESFFVKAMKKEGPLLDGELERATTWAHMLFTRVELAHPATHRNQSERVVTT
jgi:flavorubredoxin